MLFNDIQRFRYGFTLVALYHDNSHNYSEPYSKKLQEVRKKKLLTMFVIRKIANF